MGLEDFERERFERPIGSEKTRCESRMDERARKTPWSQAEHDARLRNGESLLRQKSKFKYEMGLEDFERERFERPIGSEKTRCESRMDERARKTPWSQAEHDARLRNGESLLRQKSKFKYKMGLEART
ncbi:hypothetical protein [Leptospira gomenensis]|uniref:hypothetical protein n=1 Tax=Leptospira gomenensis TaxID=2484974 RepID=UPI001083ACBB|nr:hypothetical protein [Leptospira gomenensis]